MSIEKRPHERPMITVRPNSSLTGHEFLMTRLPARDWIALRRGDLDDGELVDRAIAAIVDSSLPDDTVLDLREGLSLMRAWVAAHTEDAVPEA